MFRSPLQPMWDPTIHLFTGPSILTGTRSSLKPMWDPPIHVVSTPFRVQPPRWPIARYLALIPFLTAKAHR